MLRSPARLRLNFAWWLFAGALAVRLAYLAQGFEVPAQDTPDYDEIALNLLAGQGFVARENWFGNELRSWRTPFYPFFLALVYGVWGYSHLAVKGAQALVGAGTAVLVYGLGRRLDPATAVVAGLLAAVYGPLVAACNEVMSEVFFTFWGVLATYLLVDECGGQQARKGRLLAGGLAVGLAVLTRPVGLLLLPAFALAAGWKLGLEGLRRTLWVGLAVCCAVLPWSLRNWQVHGEWVPISTHGGFILARSNAFEPAWRQEHGWGIEQAFFQQIPSEVERDRYWYAQGIDFIAAHPGFYLRLVGERFLRFWYFLRPQYDFWFMVVLPFFLAGMWRRGWRGGYALLSAYIAVSTLVFCAVLYGSTRFRLPLEPFFLLFAAAFWAEAVGRWGRWRVGAGMGGVVLVHLLLWWQDEALRQWVLGALRQWELK